MNRVRQELLKHIKLLMKEMEQKNEELNELHCEILRLHEVIIELQLEKIYEIKEVSPQKPIT
jgi:hypothetical protein